MLPARVMTATGRGWSWGQHGLGGPGGDSPQHSQRCGVRRAGSNPSRRRAAVSAISALRDPSCLTGTRQLSTMLPSHEPIYSNRSHRHHLQQPSPSSPRGRPASPRQRMAPGARPRTLPRTGAMPAAPQVRCRWPAGRGRSSGWQLRWPGRGKLRQYQVEAIRCWTSGPPNSSSPTTA